MDELLMEVDEISTDAEYWKESARYWENQSNYWKDAFDLQSSEMLEKYLENEKLKRTIKQLAKVLMDLDETEFKHGSKE